MSLHLQSQTLDSQVNCQHLAHLVKCIKQTTTINNILTRLWTQMKGLQDLKIEVLRDWEQVKTLKHRNEQDLVLVGRQPLMRIN